MNSNFFGCSLSAFLVDVGCGAAKQVANVHAVGHEPTSFHIVRHVVYRWKPSPYCKFDNLFSLRIEHRTPQREDSLSTPLACGPEGSLNIPAI